MENNLTTAPAPVKPIKARLHQILPSQAYDIAAEVAPKVGRKTARVNLGTATTCRGTVYTVIYSMPGLYQGQAIDLVGCGSGDYLSEAIEHALENFEAKREEWQAQGLI